MGLLERLDAEIKKQDRRVIASLSHRYDQNAADFRQLLEDAKREIDRTRFIIANSRSFNLSGYRYD